ncbi:hypothetical protein E143388_07271 [Rhodococcus opacus]|nr:hypothetical protein E143388_07271 [Rhodococcus opacus]
MQSAEVRAQPDLSVGRHDVESRTERAIAADVRAEITADVLTAVPLPPQRPGQLELGGVDQCPDRHVRAHVELQRHDIGHHPT